MSPGRRRAAWAAVLAAALALRLWRLWWGLDEDLWFPDEHRWSRQLRAFVPLTWDSFAPRDLWYPTLYGYLGGLVTAVAQGVGLIDVAGPAPVSTDALRVARGLSAGAGVATVGLVGLLGRRLYDARTGLLAAALMAALPLAVLQVHYASVDVLLGMAAAALMLAAASLAERPTLARAALAGAATGLAFAAKYTGIVFGTTVAWALIEVAWTERRPARTAALALAALLGLAVAVTVACPPCVFDRALLTEAYRFHRFNTAVAVNFFNNHLTPTLGWWGRHWVYQGVAGFPFVLGVALYAAALAGVVLALLRRTRADRLLLAAAVPYLAWIGASDVTFLRYLLPLTPALVMLAARALVAVRPARARAATIAIVWTYTAAVAATQVARFSWDQQRAVARWIAARVPEAAARRELRVHAPAMLDYFRLGRPLARAGVRPVFTKGGLGLAAAPAVVVVPEWWATHLARDVPESAQTAELRRLEDGRAGYREAVRWPPSWYLQAWLDRRLDPAFAGDLWQGETGFRIYVRSDW